MKESFAKITAWIKSHPWPAAGIAVIIIVVGYFIVKKSGGNSGGESIASQDTSGLDSGGAGLSGADLSGLGTSAESSPSVLPEATPTPSVMDSFPSPGSGIGSGVFESSMDSGYSDSSYSGAGLFSAAPAVSSAELIAPKTNDTLKASTPKTAVASKALPQNVGVAASIKAAPVIQKIISSPVMTLRTAMASIAPYRPAPAPVLKAVAMIGAKAPVPALRAVASVAPKAPTLSLFKYSGHRPGYTWNGRQYIKTYVPPLVNRLGAK